MKHIKNIAALTAFLMLTGCGSTAADKPVKTEKADTAAKTVSAEKNKSYLFGAQRAHASGAQGGETSQSAGFGVTKFLAGYHALCGPFLCPSGNKFDYC